MQRTEPCLCGDPECPRCFPQSLVLPRGVEWPEPPRCGICGKTECDDEKACERVAYAVGDAKREERDAAQ